MSTAKTSSAAPASGTTTTSSPAPAPLNPAPRSPNEGREFIRAYGDGRNKGNETYLVCRLKVPGRRLEREMYRGEHPQLLTCKHDCPAHDPKYFNRAGRAAPLAAWDAADLDPRVRQSFEIVHPNTGENGSWPTFTICRIGVPRATMVEEVEAGLHPSYHTVTQPSAPESRTVVIVKDKLQRVCAAGQPYDSYVRANPGTTPVHESAPDCPFRALR